MRVSRLVGVYALEVCWELANAVYSVLQRYVVWTLLTSTGRRRRQLESDKTSDAVQVLRVVARFKLDAYLSAGKLSDFMLSHERFDSVDCVLRDNVTLYCLSKTEAIFVECPESVEVWRSSVSPFIMAAQYSSAQRVIRVPLSAFHRLAARLGDPRQQVIFLVNTARCGSTLLTQMFETTDRIVSISEPSSLNILAHIAEKGRDAATDQLIVSAIRVLCKPTSHNELAYVLKLTAPTMNRLPLVLGLFPKARALFMYRDSLKVAQSLYRLSEELPALKTVFVVGRGSKRRLGWCVDAMSLPKEDYQFELHHSLSIGAMVWAAAVKNYLQFLRDGVDVVGVRYEDILADAPGAMRRILSHCHLPEALADRAKSALGLDSQRNTPLANNVLSRHATLEYSGAVKTECDWVMDKLGATRLAQPYIAPNTITADS